MRSLSLSFFFIVFIFFIHICWLYFTIKLIWFLWRIICDQRKAIECFFNSQSPINNWEYRNIISSQNWKKNSPVSVEQVHLLHALCFIRLSVYGISIQNSFQWRPNSTIKHNILSRQFCHLHMVDKIWLFPWTKQEC